MESDISKEQLEKNWTATLMEGTRQWLSNRSSHRIYVFEGDELVVWSTPDGQRPIVDHTLTVSSIGLTSTTGIVIRVVSREKSIALVAGYLPQQVPDTDVFLWVPAFSDVRFAPRRFDEPLSPRRLTVPLCIKSPTNHLTDMKLNTFYVTERRDFVRQWKEAISV